MKEALLCGATSFFLVHNHPSGNLTPSMDDDRLTGALVEAGRMMNIKVLDHLIIGNNEYFSYADEGRL
jgi:DNA repair protein RadC